MSGVARAARCEQEGSSSACRAAPLWCQNTVSLGLTVNRRSIGEFIYLLKTSALHAIYDLQNRDFSCIKMLKCFGFAQVTVESHLPRTEIEVEPNVETKITRSFAALLPSHRQALVVLASKRPRPTDSIMHAARMGGVASGEARVRSRRAIRLRRLSAHSPLSVIGPPHQEDEDARYRSFDRILDPPMTRGSNRSRVGAGKANWSAKSLRRISVQSAPRIRSQVGFRLAASSALNSKVSLVSTRFA